MVSAKDHDTIVGYVAIGYWAVVNLIILLKAACGLILLEHDFFYEGTNLYPNIYLK